jgi:hypothetical protein
MSFPQLRTGSLNPLATSEAVAVDLTVQNATHAHVADNALLTQVHALTVQNASHSHAAGNVTLTVVISLIVQYRSTHRGVFGRVFSGVN